MFYICVRVALVAVQRVCVSIGNTTRSSAIRNAQRLCMRINANGTNGIFVKTRPFVEHRTRNVVVSVSVKSPLPDPTPQPTLECLALSKLGNVSRPDGRMVRVYFTVSAISSGRCAANRPGECCGKQKTNLEKKTRLTSKDCAA